MKIRAVVLFCLFAGIASAQSTIRPGGGSGGSSTITAGTTAWSGCSQTGGIFYAGYTAANVVLCNKAWINDATGAITLASATYPLIVPVGSLITFGSVSYLGGADQAFTGGATTGIAMRGSTAVWMGVGNLPSLKADSTNAWTIGSSSLGTSQSR